MRLTITLLLLLLTLLVPSQSACRQLTRSQPQGAPVWNAPEAPDEKVIAGKVVSVADGDTLTVLDRANTQHRIRLAGIDAPESKQDFGQASKRNLSDLVFGKQVEVRYTKFDRYDRVLGVVFYNGQDVNLRQIEAGLAWHYKEYEMDQSPEDRRSYAGAEERARAARRGLWQQPNPIKPSEFRRKAAGRE